MAEPEEIKFTSSFDSALESIGKLLDKKTMYDFRDSSAAISLYSMIGESYQLNSNPMFSWSCSPADTALELSICDHLASLLGMAESF